MTTPSTRVVRGAVSADQILGYTLEPLDAAVLFSYDDADGRPLIYAGICNDCGGRAYVVMPGKDDDAGSGYPALRAEHATHCFRWHIIPVCPCAWCTDRRGGPPCGDEVAGWVAHDVGWAAEGIARALAEGVIVRDTDGTLRPAVR